MQDTYPKIIANAERLLEDAKHLYAAKRSRSAVSLAVLAAEEIGKVVILSLPHDLRSKDYVNSLSSHREKLAAFAVMACEQMIEKVESETLETIGLPNTQEGRRDLRRMLRTMREENSVVSEAFTKALEIEDGGALSDTFVRWFTNTYLELFGSADGLGDAVGQVGTGIANKLKQYGFYVDVSAMEASPSDEPDDGNARRWILAVEQTLGSTVMKATIAALEREAKRRR